MLEITSPAITWLRENRARHHVPPDYGVRIFERPDGLGIAVHSAPQPAGEEKVVTRHGIRFFLSDAIVARLKDRLVDVAARETGSGLVIRRRPPDWDRAQSRKTPTAEDLSPPRWPGLRARSTPARPNR
jgi:hypothetical protein